MNASGGVGGSDGGDGGLAIFEGPEAELSIPKYGAGSRPKVEERGSGGLGVDDAATQNKGAQKNGRVHRGQVPSEGERERAQKKKKRNYGWSEEQSIKVPRSGRE